MPTTLCVNYKDANHGSPNIIQYIRNQGNRGQMCVDLGDVTARAQTDRTAYIDGPLGPPPLDTSPTEKRGYRLDGDAQPSFYRQPHNPSEYYRKAHGPAPPPPLPHTEPRPQSNPRYA